MANWIKGAIKHPGAFSAKAKAAGKSVHEFAEEHKGSPGTLGKQARLYFTLMHFHTKDETDLKKPGDKRSPGQKLYQVG